jgi:thiamine-monophosphate kinase
MKKLTALQELGEFQLIDRLTKDVSLFHESTVKGIGDDAAVLNYGNVYLVLTTDILMEGIHFDLVYTPMKHLGYKAAVVNFSDVYAMNAYPKQLVVSMALSRKFSVEALEEFYNGLQLACKQYKVDLVGGDTSASVTGLAISITVLGEVEKQRLTYRSTAMENDLICVSGDLGAAYLGLQVLEREKKIFEISKSVQPKLEGYEYILQRQLRPEARKEIIDFLYNNNIIPTSMIDVSDGLASELRHICSQSGKGCKVFQNKIPIHEQTIETAKELNMEPLICALNGGEDYELLFTASLEYFDVLSAGDGISIIGYISSKESGCNLMTELDQEIPLLAQGWESPS